MSSKSWMIMLVFECQSDLGVSHDLRNPYRSYTGDSNPKKNEFLINMVLFLVCKGDLHDLGQSPATMGMKSNCLVNVDVKNPSAS